MQVTDTGATGFTGPRAALVPVQKPKRSTRDAVLIDRIMRGETALFYELVLPYQDSLFSLLVSVLRHRVDAEEIQQETMLKAFVNLRHLRQKTKFRAWLFQIAVNEARMRLRERRVHNWRSLEELPQALQAKCMLVPMVYRPPSASERLYRMEMGHAIAAALASLRPKYHRVFVLRHVEEMSIDETAARLQISAACVKTRTRRACLLLRSQVGPFIGRGTDDREKATKKLGIHLLGH